MVSRHKQPQSTGALPVTPALEALDRTGLVDLWPQVMGGAVPRGMSQAIMRRFLAFEVQAQVHGGLTRREMERLERLASGKARAPSERMAHGARFLREWNGVTHVVERRADGYVWNGAAYASLSAIAKLITGAHWSGPRFFGVAAAKAPGRKAAALPCRTKRQRLIGAGEPR